MARFGGNEFTGFSVPLVFEGRYFVMEPGNPPSISVFLERNSQPAFEVLKNQPVENDVTDVSMTPPGIVTVSEKKGQNALLLHFMKRSKRRHRSAPLLNHFVNFLSGRTVLYRAQSR